MDTPLGTVTVRAADRTDTRRLFRWANDPDTRRWSFSNDPIPWDNHVAWVERSLANTNRVLLIGSDGLGEVGTVRFDRDGTTSEVSITVAPECRGLGMARPLLSAALHHAPTTQIVAQVLESNEASRRLFAGWHVREVRDGVSVFVLG